MAEKLELDVAQALAGLKQMRAEIDSLRNSAEKASKSTKDFLPETSRVTAVTDEIKKLQSEYARLKDSAATLKRGLATATDPRAISAYAGALAQAEAGMKKLEQAAKSTGAELGTANKSASVGKEVFSSFFGSFSAAALITAAIAAVVSFTKNAVELADQTKKAQLSFEAFTGSASKADSLLKELNKTAQKKFLSVPDVQQGAKALLGANVEAEKIPKTLERIADVSAATGKDFTELATIFAKAKTQGTLFAEDINQLLDAGVPIIGEFAKQLGVSGDQVKKLASEGKIQFSELELAFANLTAQGGKFYGQSETGAKTVSGAWKKLTSELQPSILAIGSFFSELTQDILNGTTSLIQGAKELFGGRVDSALADQQALEKDRAAYEKDLNERQAIEDEARKNRNKKSADQAKKEADAARKAAEERAKLLIEALRDGEEKEIAQENLRFSELAKNLRKYHIDTSQAEEQHQKNLTEIQIKYWLERYTKQQDAIEYEKQLVQRGFDELSALEEKDAAAKAEVLKQRQEAKKAAADESAAIAAYNAADFEASLLNARKIFFSKKRSDDEIAAYEKNVQKAREIFQLEAQRSELKRALDFNDTLTETEKATLKIRIENISKQIEEIQNGSQEGQGKSGGFSIYKLFGINDDSGKRAFDESVNNIVAGIQQITNEKVQAAEEEVRITEDRVKKAEDALKAQEDLEKQGFANSASLRRQDLENAQKDRDAALEKQRKAQRQQILADAALQSSSLITSAANIIKGWSSLPGIGQVLAVASIAAMFALFAKTKADALKATNVKAKHGMFGQIADSKILTGPSHDGGGVQIEAEGGELVAASGQRFGIVNKEATREYWNVLQAVNSGSRPAITEALLDMLQIPGVDHASAKSLENKVLQHEKGNANQGTIERLMEENNRLLQENNRLLQERPDYVATHDGYIELKNGSIKRRVRT